MADKHRCEYDEANGGYEFCGIKPDHRCQLCVSDARITELEAEIADAWDAGQRAGATGYDWQSNPHREDGDG